MKRLSEERIEFLLKNPYEAPLATEVDQMLHEIRHSRALIEIYERNLQGGTHKFCEFLNGKCVLCGDEE